ncbi:MAG: DUF1501 domain-containing protein [Myxococcota bacterium]
MDRRSFVKLAGVAGLGVVAPKAFGENNGLVGKGRTSYEQYKGAFWIFVNAAGGYDPTSFCDPKGANYLDEPDRMNNYLAEDIEEAGNIRYAPVAGNAAFFQKYYDRMLVINGIDMLTNGHDAGNRHTWSGRLTEGHPSMPALIAGGFGPNQPLSFMTSGGYSETAGVVSRTRTGDNIDSLRRLAYPNRMNPDDEFSSFHPPTGADLIRSAHTEREGALVAAQGLPRIKASMSTLFAARSGSNELKLLEQYLPEMRSQNNLASQGEVALAAYKAGIAVSTMLSTGGFDTHGNHDDNHFPRLQTLTEGVDRIMEFAEELGVADQVVVAIGSDFGRTPGYNDGNGKDHWPITSQVFLGSSIRGNTVIGSSDERHGGIGLNFDTLASDESAPNLQPGHIIASIRQRLGLEEFASKFPLEEQALDLFG